MSSDFDHARLAERLRDETLVDLNGVIKPGGRAETLAAVERWKEHGLRTYVLVARGFPLKDIDALWAALHADPQRELLLVFDTRTWAARGGGLDAARIAQALHAAQPALRQYWGRGLARAVDLLGEAATGKAAPPVPTPERPKDNRPRYAAGLIGGSVGALLVIGALGFVIRRRNQRAREGRAVFDEARASAERAYTDLMLAAEELDREQASQLQLKAAELKKRIDALVDEANAHPAQMRDPVTLGRIRQFENELAALRSTSLQQARRG